MKAILDKKRIMESTRITLLEIKNNYYSHTIASTSFAGVAVVIVGTFAVAVILNDSVKAFKNLFVNRKNTKRNMKNEKRFEIEKVQKTDQMNREEMFRRLNEMNRFISNKISTTNRITKQSQQNLFMIRKLD